MAAWAAELVEYLAVLLGMKVNAAAAPCDLVGATLGRHEGNPALRSAADSLGSISWHTLNFSNGCTNAAVKLNNFYFPFDGCLCN